VIYTQNRTSGQWKAHGRYIGRESATQDPSSAGFDAARSAINVAAELDRWQAAGDQRLWKLIISPEFGERLDLQKLTRHMLGCMEKDLGTSLEWVAVSHFNTEHPHVHVALRGVRDDGSALDLKRDYIRSGIRRIAENGCTLQLGYKTVEDALAASEREISQNRYTSLDRAIRRANTGESSDWNHFTVRVHVAERVSDSGQIQNQHVCARLATLRHMGLAEEVTPQTWHVRDDFETVLRAMQRASDRQKMLAAHGALLSDERLQLVTTDIRSVSTIAGRVILHGEEEAGTMAGRNYLLLEGTDGMLHMLYYTAEMEEARSRGKLRVNSFIRMRNRFAAGHPELKIEDLGNAEAILKDRIHLQDMADSLTRRGAMITEPGWGGWLGRYQAALRTAADQLEQRKLGQSRGR
jgi:type IV secretory pathway VirD2 relaxase